MSTGGSWRWLAAVLCVFLIAGRLSPAPAADVPVESLRYELGRRLRAFEAAFDSRRDDIGARRAVAVLVVMWLL